MGPESGQVWIVCGENAREFGHGPLEELVELGVGQRAPVPRWVPLQKCPEPVHRNREWLAFGHPVDGRSRRQATQAGAAFEAVPEWLAAHVPGTLPDLRHHGSVLPGDDAAWRRDSYKLVGIPAAG